MSDLEQQAASWVPPWQRAGAPSTPDTDSPDADAPSAGSPDADSSDADSPAAAPAEASVAEAALAEAALAEAALAEAAGIDEEIPTDEPWREVEPNAANDSKSFAATSDALHAGGTATPSGTDSGAALADTAAHASGAALADGGAEAAAVGVGDVGGGEAGAGDAAAERAAVVGKAKAKAAKRMAAAKAALAAEDEANQAMVPGQRESEEDGVRELPPLPGLAAHEIAPALEAILMVVDEPVSELLLATVLEITVDEIAGTLTELSAGYTRDGKGFDLRRVCEIMDFL